MRGRGYHISKGILRIIYCGGIFILSLFVLSSFMNRGNTDMTMSMPDATYPLVSFLCENRPFNQMHGYAQEMDAARVREHITPLPDERKLEFVVDTYGNEIDRISFKIRSLQDERLIEETQIYDYAREGDTIRGSLTIKDLLRKDAEYSLCLMLETNAGAKLYYYTQLLRSSECALAEKLDFVSHFSELTFDRVRGAAELPTYLESNAQGDNTTFHKVDIHSGANQVCWGNLPVEQLTEPMASVKDIDAETAQICLDYIVQIPEETRVRSYFVEECFRVRLGSERMYLLDYERTTDQIFTLGEQEKKEGVPDVASVIAGNKIVLGIADTDVQKMESLDGNILAFVNCGRLFVYDASDNHISEVFSFYGDDLKDRRETARSHDIRICQVQETGNIVFLVYGYMNCGGHEGQMGVTVYEYDSTLNTVEEKVFVPYDGGYEFLNHDMEKLAFAGDHDLHLLLQDSVYDVSLEGAGCKALAEELPIGGVISSADGVMAVWSNGSDLYDAKELTMKNLMTNVESPVRAGEGERVIPISFFGADLVYGIAAVEDITQDISGHTVFAMHSVCIRDEEGAILKEYSQPGIFITGVDVSEGMITLHRATRDENGELQPYVDDQILNNSKSGNAKNTIETAVTERFETIVQIAVRSEIKTSSMKILDPRFVIFEGERIAETEPATRQEYYYLYQKGHLQGIYDNAYEPVKEVFEGSGVVRDAGGTVVYRRMSLPVKNQIMAISESVTKVESDEIPLTVQAAALDTMLAYMGVHTQTAEQMEDGSTAREILKENLPTAVVVDLSGVTPDALLYYTAQDIPVLMSYRDGSAMLLIGYNELNIVVLNPKGRENGDQVYKIGRGDAAKLLAENGNRFLVCLRPED